MKFHENAYQHMFSEPAFFFSQIGADPKSETFFTQERIATVTASIADNFISVGPIGEILI